MALNGFFGNLWNKVKHVVGGIIGGLIGGPIGAIVGQTLQHYIDTAFGFGDGEVQAGEPDNGGGILNAAGDEEFPISDLEEAALLSYFTRFANFIKYYANLVDTEIMVATSTMSKGATVSANPFINKANEVLFAISVLRANNSMILQNGEPNRTTNYVKNKVAFAEKYLLMLEKAVLGYVTNNVIGYKLVSKSTLFSQNMELGEVGTGNGMRIYWYANQVSSTVKEYVLQDQVIDDGTEIDVTDTDVNSDGSATSNDTSISDVIQTAQKSKLTNVLLFFGLGYLVSKATN